MNMRDLVPWGRQTSNNQAPVPYREGEMSPFFSLRREVDRLFDDFFRMPSLGFAGTAMSWPSLEVADQDREVRVTAEIPGMNEKDVELLVQDGVLTIRGEKRNETSDKDRCWSERWYGRFERRIALPSGIEEEKAQANFRDGVLTVTLPKSSEAAHSRRIPINGETKH
jgi:HSP20 family protein